MHKFKRIQALAKSRGDGNWYRMEVKDDVADVYIYDEISWWGVEAELFVKDLNAIDAKTIRVHLNTPGGSVFDGIAIYNALKQHKAIIETYVEGLAASTGSIVALAGDTIYMAENAFFMIHHPWVMMMGNAEELRKEADVLDKISSVMISTYMKVSGQSEDQIKQWLDDETWFTAQEAKDAGFISEITDGVDEQASYNVNIYDNVPDKLMAEFKKNSSKSKKQDRKEEPAATGVRQRMQMRLQLADV